MIGKRAKGSGTRQGPCLSWGSLCLLPDGTAFVAFFTPELDGFLGSTYEYVPAVILVEE